MTPPGPRTPADDWKQVWVKMPPGLRRKLREYANRHVPRLPVSAVIVMACARFVDYDPERDADDQGAEPPADRASDA